MMRKLALTSLLTPQKLTHLRDSAVEASRAEGAVAEVGVYKGGSARLIARTLPSRALYLFDTFEGLPDQFREEDQHYHKPGQFAASLPEVAMTLAGHEPAELHYQVGIFPDSAAGLEHLRFCFVHVDVDLFRSVSDCCVWFTPRMSRGGIIVFDDYSAHTTPGCPLAVDAYFGTRVEVHPSGPAVVRF